MATTLRVLALLDLLQAGGWIAGPDLARRLEVEPRQLRRDIVRLEEIGVPVETLRGRGGGYRLAPGFRLPPLMLTDDEAAAVSVALTAASRQGLGLSTPALEAAGAKVRRVLPSRLRERIDAMESVIDFSPRPSGSSSAEGSVLLALSDAIRRRRRVAIEYVARAGTPSRREVDAWGVALVGRHWYVVGLDHASGEERTFRVDRVRRATVGAIPATLPKGVDAAAMIAERLASVPRRWTVVVLADASIADVRASLPATIAELSTVQAGTRVVLRADDLGGAGRLLASVSWPFAVLEPPELRGVLRDRARALERACEE